MNILDVVDAASLRKDIPQFRAGDELKIHVRVIEGNKSRLQVFQGIVIARQGDGVRETFTIRKVSYGVGVERTFPVHTPVIEKIELVRRAKFVAPSCTSSAIFAARLPRFAKSAMALKVTVMESFQLPLPSQRWPKLWQKLQLKLQRLKMLQ